MGLCGAYCLFSSDIYTDLISPGLGNPKLFVQTWRPSLKNTQRVRNTNILDLNNLTFFFIFFFLFTGFRVPISFKKKIYYELIIQD